MEPKTSRYHRAATRETLLREWSVPVLAELDEPRRFSELRTALAVVIEVLPTRPPSTVYRRSRRADTLLGGEHDLGPRAGA